MEKKERMREGAGREGEGENRERRRARVTAVRPPASCSPIRSQEAKESNLPSGAHSAVQPPHLPRARPHGSINQIELNSIDPFRREVEKGLDPFIDRSIL